MLARRDACSTRRGSQRVGLGYDVKRDRSSARIVSGQYTKHTGYLTGHTDSVTGSRGRVDGRDDRALGHGDFPAGETKGVNVQTHSQPLRSACAALAPDPGSTLGLTTLERRCITVSEDEPLGVEHAVAERYI